MRVWGGSNVVQQARLSVETVSRVAVGVSDVHSKALVPGLKSIGLRPKVLARYSPSAMAFNGAATFTAGAFQAQKAKEGAMSFSGLNIKHPSPSAGFGTAAFGGFQVSPAKKIGNAEQQRKAKLAEEEKQRKVDNAKNRVECEGAVAMLCLTA